MILKTCSNTDIPPKPSKKAVNIILIEIFLQAILEIELIPFVISKNPEINGAAKEKSIFRVSKIGAINKANIFKIPLAFKIDITLEKITTNPPINNIVEILLIILSDKIEPRLEKVIFSFEAELGFMFWK